MKTQQPVKRRRVLRRYSVADRERLLRAQAHSGLTIKAFCEREGIKPWTFYEWTKKRGMKKRRRGFAEVEVTPSPAAAIEVVLPNGARIGIRQQGGQEQLVALVRGLAGCQAGGA